MAGLLPENVTLADLIADGRLRRPPHYLRIAFANMLLAGEFGSVALRIGRTGNGTWPMYIFERKDGSIAGRFEGQAHKPWSLDEGDHHDENWSSTRITAVELHGLWRKVTPDA